MYTPAEPTAPRGYTVSINWDKYIMETSNQFLKTSILAASIAIILLAYSALAQEDLATGTTEAETETETPVGQMNREDQGNGTYIMQANPGGRGEEVNETREEIVEARQEVRTERQTALKEVRQQRVINLAANISNRMDKATDRLFNIIERLERRVIKLQQEGKVTTSAEAKIREAARALAEARSLMQGIDVLVNNATLSAEPRTGWVNVKERYLAVGKLIRQAHQDLRTAISFLKNPERVEIPETATEETEDEAVPTLAE